MIEMKYNAIIFDLDGTIIDPRGKGSVEYGWAYNALRKTLEPYGINLSNKEIDKKFLQLFHSRGKLAAEEFCSEFGIKDYQSFWKARERDAIEAKISAIDREEIPLYPDVWVVKKLYRQYDLAIASDSQQACVDHVVRHFGLQPYFKLWYGRGSEPEDLEKLKPNPFLLNRILEELQLDDRKKAVLVDDSLINGSLVAERAGIDFILLCREAKNLNSTINNLPSTIKKPTHLILSLMELEEVLV
ncbi:MAG: HAD hydrolase-like protein [Candidatus Aenigmarchaeota archaeon]|nr:HAD hydrolase-like protein [Candidatus Aenigmarchaeota archaeon]